MNIPQSFEYVNFRTLLIMMTFIIFVLFGFFLLVLSGIMLLEAMRFYLRQNIIHFEIFLGIALVAITSVVIFNNFKNYDSKLVIGITAMTLAICLPYYILGRKRRIKLH